MPGFDGTGPRGQGPMTGGGRGYCALPLTGTGRPFFGRGPCGRGGGRGFRNRFWTTGLTGWERAGFTYPAVGMYPYAPNVTAKQEADMLKQEAEALKTQLDDIQTRIETLEKIDRTDAPEK